MQFHSKLFALARPQNLCHIQKDRHFVELAKSCSGHPKTSKFTKKSIIFKIQIIFTYEKYRRKQNRSYLYVKFFINILFF